MKVRPSVKPICEYCKVIRRNGRVMVFAQQIQNTNNVKDKIERRKHGSVLLELTFQMTNV